MIIMDTMNMLNKSIINNINNTTINNNHTINHTINKQTISRVTISKHIIIINTHTINKHTINKDILINYIIHKGIIIKCTIKVTNMLKITPLINKTINRQTYSTHTISNPYKTIKNIHNWIRHNILNTFLNNKTSVLTLKT